MVWVVMAIQARVGRLGLAREKARPSAAPVFQTLYFRSTASVPERSAPVGAVFAGFVLVPAGAL
jgi:hypothetical protein